jgi:hypothetical protein
VERGRKEPAPTVGPIAYLPTLSLPLQGGDVGPTVFPLQEGDSGSTVLGREEGNGHPQRAERSQQKSERSLLQRQR